METPKKTLFFWMGMINQDVKITQVVFCFFNILGLVFCIDKSQTQKKWVFLWYPDWSYPFKTLKQPKVFFVFLFQNQKTHGKQKSNLLSQNQTFSQKFFCFFWWISLFFLVCLLIHMIAMCVLLLAYLIGPGKSNFDQSFPLESLRTMWDWAWHRMCCDVYALEN